MADAELQLKISLAKQGLEGDAAAAAKAIKNKLGGIDAEISLQADDAQVKRLEAAVEQLAKETVDTARQAQYLKDAYNLSDAEVNKVIGQMQRLERATAEAKDEGRNLGAVLGGLAGAAAFKALDLLIGALQSATQAMVGFVSSTLEIGGAAQQAEVAFTTILGSAEKAEATLNDLSNFAATTPFDLPQVTQAGQQLLAFGFNAENLTGTLTRIGDVAAGVNTDFGELATIYGKARVQGTLFAEDINQLTERGIPIIQQLAQQFGVAESEVKNLVSSGQVGFAQLEQAFINLTSAGGQFGGLMAAQAQTIPGQITNIQDGFVRLQTAIFEAFSPAIAGGLQTFSAILAEAGEQSAGLDVLAESAQRLQIILEGNPAIVEEFGAALADVGDALVNQLAAILDALSAFLSEEGNVEAMADQFQSLVGAIEAVGTTVRILIALADSLAQIKAQASGLPVVGDNLERWMRFPTPLNLLKEALLAVGEVFGLIKDKVVDMVDGTLDSINRMMPVLGPLIDRVRQVLDLIRSDPPAEGDALQAATDNLQDVQRAVAETQRTAEAVAETPITPTVDPEPAESALTGLVESNQQALEQIETDTLAAKTDLVNSGAAQEELAEREQEGLRQRIEQNQQFLEELKQLQEQGGLSSEDAEAVADQIRQIEGRLAQDRLRFAEQSADAEQQYLQSVEEAREAAAEAEIERQRQIKEARLAAIQEQAAASQGEAQFEAGQLDNQSTLVGQKASLAQSELALLEQRNSLEEERLQTQIAQAEAAGNAIEAERMKAELTELQRLNGQEEFAMKQKILEIQLQQAEMDAQRQVAQAEFNALKAEEALLVAQIEGASPAQLANLERQVTLAHEQVDIAERNLTMQGQLAENQRELLRTEQQITREREQQADYQAEAREREEASGSGSGMGSGSTSESDGRTNVVSLQDRTNSNSGSAEQYERKGVVYRNYSTRTEAVPTLENRLAWQAGRNPNLSREAALALHAGRNPALQGLAVAGTGSPGRESSGSGIISNALVSEVRNLNQNVSRLADSPRTLNVTTPDPIADTTRILGDISRQKRRRRGV